MISNAHIGGNIKAARIKRRKTQREIATQLRVSTTYYGKIERGEALPNLARLIQISDILSTSIESLLIGAVPLFSYNDLPPPDHISEVISRICKGCSNDTADVIVQICKLVAGLSK